MLTPQLVEAQRRTEERVEELAEAQKRTEEELKTLTQRVDSLAQKVEELAEAQRRIEERLTRLERTVEELAEVQRRLVIDVGELKGESLKRRYRERAPAYFRGLVSRAKAIPLEELSEILETALDEGRLSEDEVKEVMDSDLVVRGVMEGREAYLVVEVSWGIGVGDVERASRRAGVLRKLGLETRGVVAGRGITADAKELADEVGVDVVMDGRVWR